MPPRDERQRPIRRQFFANSECSAGKSCLRHGSANSQVKALEVSSLMTKISLFVALACAALLLPVAASASQADFLPGTERSCKLHLVSGRLHISQSRTFPGRRMKLRFTPPALTHTARTISTPLQPSDIRCRSALLPRRNRRLVRADYFRGGIGRRDWCR